MGVSTEKGSPFVHEEATVPILLIDPPPKEEPQSMETRTCIGVESFTRT